MALRTSEVYRCLEKKTLIFGFEMVDLFLLFSTLAILNFVLQGTSYKFLLSWGPALLLAALLRMGKAGKPDNYLQHLLVFFVLTPLVLSAFPLAPKRSRFLKPFKKGAI